jgi:hypothetical protein
MIMEGRRRRRSQKEEEDDDNNAGPGWLAGWLAPAVVIIIISVYTRAITSHQRRVQPRPFRLFLLLLLLPIRRRRRSHWAAALHISPGRPAEIIHAPAAGQGGEYIINDNQCSYILLYCPCTAEKKIQDGPFYKKNGVFTNSPAFLRLLSLERGLKKSINKCMIDPDDAGQKINK